MMVAPTQAFDVVGFIMDLENGSLSPKKVLEGFGELIRTGLARQLQGSYGRAAERLILQGLVDRDGTTHPELLRDEGRG